MCASMADIQCVMAETRRGKKKIEITAKICPHLLRRAAININASKNTQIYLQINYERLMVPM